MANGQPSRVWKALLAWIRKPESWLSIAAAAISIFTFYVVYAKSGDLEIYLADEIGLGVRRDSKLFFVLPITMVNTGASARSRVVEGISAIVTKRSVPSDSPSYSARWREEYTFVGKDQYLQKYPKKVTGATEPRFHDYLDYNGRAVPFPVQGGSSVSKVLGLVQEEGDFAGSLREFTVKLLVRAGREAFESEAQFDCGERPIEVDVTHYCRRKI